MTQTSDNIKTMSRQASDNKYLHKDFHLSLNILMDHILKNFGKEHLTKYLEQFAIAYYKPLRDQMKSGDMDAMRTSFAERYKDEEWPVRINLEKERLTIEQDACPGISHIRSKGGNPISDYVETYRTIYSTLCKETPFEYELVCFDNETGACKQIFKRKETTE